MCATLLDMRWEIAAVGRIKFQTKVLSTVRCPVTNKIRILNFSQFRSHAVLSQKAKITGTATSWTRLQLSGEREEEQEEGMKTGGSLVYPCNKQWHFRFQKICLRDEVQEDRWSGRAKLTYKSANRQITKLEKKKRYSSQLQWFLQKELYLFQNKKIIFIFTSAINSHVEQVSCNMPLWKEKSLTMLRLSHSANFFPLSKGPSFTVRIISSLLHISSAR